LQADLAHGEGVAVFADGQVSGGVRYSPLVDPAVVVNAGDVGKQGLSTSSAGTLRQVSTSKPAACVREQCR